MENSKLKPTGPPGWGLCEGLTTPPWKKYIVTETSTNISKTNFVSGRVGAPPRRSMTRCSQTRKEVVEPTPPLLLETPHITSPRLLSRRPVLIGTWNVRTLRETGRSAQAAREMAKYNLTVLGLCEVRWNGHGQVKLGSGETIFYSGKENEEDRHEAGVALMMSKQAVRSLLEWEPVSDRIITARFESRFQKVTIVMAYSPTNNAEEEEKEQFYTQLQAVVDKIPRRDMLILMGDMNSKVGTDNTDREREMGQYGLGEMNNNGELLADFCATNSLVIGGTIFPHKRCHKATWVSPDHKTENQIDHIMVRQRYRSSLQDVRVRRGADINSDHHLVVAKIKMRLSARETQRNPRKKFNVKRLKEVDVKQTFQISLQNRFQVLQTEETETVEHQWNTFKDAVLETCEDVLGRPQTNRKPWIKDETWKKIEERRQAKLNVNQAKTRQQKQQASTKYSIIAKTVKKDLRADKRAFINTIADEAEEAASKGDLKTLYATTRLLSGRRTNPNKPVRDKEGKLLTNIDEQLVRWKEHFQEVLNRPPPCNRPELEPGTPLNVNTGEITKTEIRKALKSLKNDKAAGTDNIPAEALKEGGESIVHQLHHLINLIWTKEEMPIDWKKGLLVKLPKHGDLSKCGKWRGITLLSIPSKVLTKIILDRIKDALDKTLRDEQAGFRKERSCTDQIATLGIIVEQSIEWQSPLYTCFVDFEKAFDSVDREAIWNILLHYGVPSKFVDIIRRFYDGFSCQVIHNGRLSDGFEISSGVRQGCLLSPLLFLVVLDWVTRTAYSKAKKGIQWTIMTRLEDLEFADDLALLSHRLLDMQEKITALEETAQKVGLKISQEKTKVMRTNSTLQESLTISGTAIEDVHEFTYLGSKISNEGGTDEDIKTRIKKARQAFAILKPVWRATTISTNTKLRIFSSNVKSVLLYGSETWRVTKTSSSKVQTFVNGCIRQILRLRWFDKVSNTDLWSMSNQQPIDIQIRRRKWRWIGHTLRKATSNTTKMALEWNPQGKRKRGRPKQSWRRSVMAELKSSEMTWGEAKIAARDRRRWKNAVEALCSTRNQEE